MYQTRQKRQTRLSLNGSHAERLKVSLYVGNLDSTVNDHDLARAFVEAGKVLGSQIIRDRVSTKRSRGFGFVEMASRDNAEEAIAKLRMGEILKGRAISVRSHGSGNCRKSLRLNLIAQSDRTRTWRNRSTFKDRRAKNHSVRTALVRRLILNQYLCHEQSVM